MRIHWLAFMLGASAALVLVSVHADQSDTGYTNTHFTVDAGITGGGDKLATVTFTDGSTKSIYAGNAVFGDVGFLTNFGASRWSLKGTLGYAYTAVVASNATISFSHFPLDVIGMYSFGRSHFGFGVTYQMSPKLDMDGYAPNADFNNSTGWLLEYRYWLFGVRYTNITYRSSQGNVRGNSLGLFFNYTF
ncbi:MAG: hypothetical protein ACRER0_01115 [Gammaproteobacteria bacterium]